MAVKETNAGRRRTSKRTERTYYITGAATEAEALAELLASNQVPNEIDGHQRADAEWDADELEAGRYLGTAVYLSPEASPTSQQPINSFSISFDIAGQTTRITQSKRTVARYAPAGQTPKDFHGAINVQQDGTIEGTEIFTPALSFVLTYTFADEDITGDYINKLSLLVGTVNNNTFKGSAAGESLLTRVSGQRRTDGSNSWDLTFGFSISRNCTQGKRPNGEDFKIESPSGDITITAKRGWDYLWVRYEEDEVGEGANKATYKVPVSAYVEQVYDYANYALLGIGT